MRAAAQHAPAAYLASRTSTRELCAQIDPSFQWEATGEESWLQASLQAHNAKVEVNHRISEEQCGTGSTPLSQKKMSSQVEAFSFRALFEDSPTPDKARLLAVSAPHASGWLQARPAEGLDQRWTHAEFVSGLQVWLGTQVQSTDTWCPMCDQILDARGHHCMTCMAGGHADQCHSSLRDYVYSVAFAAGLSPEKEESGLLPDNPRRRPGDLYFALWPWGGRAALDFAVTSPLQLTQLGPAARGQLSAAMAYEAHKLGDRDTAARCAAMGITLYPVVAESFAGWGPTAQAVFKVIAGASAARSGLSIGVVTSQFYEGLSTRIMRANARSLLARVGQDVEGSGGLVASHGRAMVILGAGGA